MTALPPIIRSNTIRGKSADWVIFDDPLGPAGVRWDPLITPTSWTRADFDMRREGRKQYAFYRRNGGPCAIQRYACSHIEAKRRFTLFLITKRLLS